MIALGFIDFILCFLLGYLITTAVTRRHQLSQTSTSNAKMASNGRKSKIEALAKRAVALETDEFEAEGSFLKQESSPLFAMLPRELRDMIWGLALAPYEDSEQKFEPTEYFCRPGHMARLKTDYRLLLTCRRVWLEGHAMPMLQAEHSFYYFRAAPDARDPKWMARLTEKNLQDFGHLHLYCQMYAVERRLTTTPGRVRDMFLKETHFPGDFQPRVLHVTLRHTDWWNWEDEAPLRLEDGWVKALLNSPDLRSTETLMLEMETLDYKVDQLEPIVERIKSFVSEEVETHIVDGKPTKTKFSLVDRPSVYTWEGPSNINKQDFSPYRGKDKLKYHVITLVWKLKFPDIPRAFVPHLRRAPRFDPRRPPTTDETDSRQWLTEQGRSQNMNKRFGYEYRRRRVVPGVGDDRKLRLFRRRHRPNAGVPVVIADQTPERSLLYMRELEQRVRRNARDLAQAVEEDRRWEFDMAMSESEAKKWQARWEKEGSLLRFAE